MEMQPDCNDERLVIWSKGDETNRFDKTLVNRLDLF